MSYQDQSIERKFEVAGSSAPKKISKIQFGKDHSLGILFATSDVIDCTS